MLSPVTIESTPNATALGAAINPLMLKLYGILVSKPIVLDFD